MTAHGRSFLPLQALMCSNRRPNRENIAITMIPSDEFQRGYGAGFENGKRNTEDKSVFIVIYKDVDYNS